MGPGFPFGDVFEIGGRTFDAQTIIERLGPYITELRRRRIGEVVAERTCTVVPVLDGLYDHGNVNAVLRSVEGLGYLVAHVIESSARFKVAGRVTQGAEKWLVVRRWSSSSECVSALARDGYRIVATHTEEASPIDTVDFTRPTALVFGNEHAGVSQAVLEVASARVKVPMGGFSESFNISVAAGMCLYHARLERLRRLGRHGDLTAEERRRLTAVYYLRSIKNAERILAGG